MAKKIINPQISGTTTIIQGTQIVSGNEGIDRQLQEAMSRIPERNKWVDGAFEGGVSYSPAYVGSLQVLEQSGIWFKRVAGTSAGGIIAGLIAVGYSASEIRWLTSNFPHRQVRPSSLPPNVAPLNLLEFLDLPVPNTISREMLQKTPEWEMIRGNAFEAFLDENLNIPTRSNLVNLVIQVINESNVFNTLITTGPNLTKLRKGLNEKAFPTFPNKVAKVRDFLQRSSDHDRREFAFKVCAELARTNPYYVLAIHLRQGREIFNGRRFLELYGPLLIAKRNQRLRRNSRNPVTFQELEIPLAVSAWHSHSQSQELYAHGQNPESLSVVEAIRRCIALPVLFESKGLNNLIQVGNVVSTFPSWSLHTSQDQIWRMGTVDHSLPKVSFQVNPIGLAPPIWNVAAPKFTVPGQNLPLDEIQVLFQVASKIWDIHLKPGPLVPGGVPAAREFERQPSISSSGTAAGRVSRRSIAELRNQMNRVLMQGGQFYQVDIPLQGFSALDLEINSNEQHLNSIAQRGFHATLDALSQSPIVGAGAPLIPDRGTVRMTF